ncbi:FAD-binding oxidoreductase [Nocardioides sp. AN3]
MSSSRPTHFRGRWVEPGHPEYESARLVFNRRADPWPAVIARCAGVADVVAAIAVARERGLEINVRCTGYTFGGLTAGNGIVIDLSLMRGVQVLPDQRVARIQGGVRGGDLQIEAAVHGLGAVTGLLSGVGAGMMLGGGIGHLAPRVGFASDNILSVELVTAAGEVVTASPSCNSDLFWAVRGSTGNFGVVTALEVRLHEVPPFVHGGSMSWSFDTIGGGIEALRSAWEWGPDELSLIGVLSSTSSDDPGGLTLYVCHSGPAEQARADLERLRSFGAPDRDNVSAIPFRDLHFLFDDVYGPTRGTMDEQSVSAFGDELVDELIADVRRPAGGGARFIEVIPYRGALGRAPSLPSARQETSDGPIWSVSPGCFWEQDSEDAVHVQWVAETISNVRRIGPTDDRQHPNAVAATASIEAVGRMYGKRFQRLRDLKRQWDPDNVFAGSHNIPPAEG